MQQSVIWKFALSLALGVGLANADTFTLKNGETFEGKIVETNADSYVVRIKKGGIATRRKISKLDIAKLEKEAPDKKPFMELQSALPIPDLLPANDYMTVIETKLKPFLGKFPKSENAAKVKEMLKLYEDELARVKNGDKKLNGEWITAENWNANAIGNDAMIEFAKMESVAKRGRLRNAMILHDKIEKSFPGTEAARKAHALATEILPTYQRQVSEMVLRSADKIKKREDDFKNVPKRDQKRVRLAFEQTMKKHEQKVETAKNNGIRWIPTNEFDSNGLKRLRSHIESTLRKLERGPRNKKDVGQLYRDAWEQAGKGNAKGLKRPFKKLKSAKVDQKYLTLLQEHLEANPAPTIVEVAPKPKMEKKAKPEPKKEKKKKKMRKPAAPEEDLPEEEGSMLPIFGGIGLLALIGILVAFFTKKKKGAEA